MQCAAVKIQRLLSTTPPHRKRPFSLSMTCHGQAPRAAHWPLMMYGPTFVMFGERRPHSSIQQRLIINNINVQNCSLYTRYRRHAVSNTSKTAKNQKKVTLPTITLPKCQCAVNKVTDPFLCQKPETSNPYNFVTYDRISMNLVGMDIYMTPCWWPTFRWSWPTSSGQTRNRPETFCHRFGQI